MMANASKWLLLVVLVGKYIVAGIIVAAFLGFAFGIPIVWTILDMSTEFHISLVAASFRFIGSLIGFAVAVGIVAWAAITLCGGLE